MLTNDGDKQTKKQASKRNQALRKTSALYKLDPPVHVGDPISREDTPGDLKHPVIIPRKGHLTELLVQYHHLKVEHIVEA